MGCYFSWVYIYISMSEIRYKARIYIARREFVCIIRCLAPANQLLLSESLELNNIKHNERLQLWKQ